VEARRPVAADVATPVRNDKLTVMVVDDSITVRKVTTRLLQQHGFEVVTAKDGVDAMGQLQDCLPDMMLLDIEMPRMDGFELATHMRNDDRFRHIPITMITSRTGDKHRRRAREIGIDHYLGKPYQEHELLNTIHRLIGISTDEPAGYREQADG
jgi:chemosensory pili system protein ChpA (sensor histidine kinase/response regulator)